MLNIAQFRELIVKPVLRELILDSAGAEELLVFTCANESLGGTYLHQLNGPALGIYQMEPETHFDIWNNYITFTPRINLLMSTNFQCARVPSPDRLIYDLRYSTVMARIFYARIPAPIPAHNDIDGIWSYYKEFYNTPKGSAQKDSAIANYRRFLDSRQGS